MKWWKILICLLVLIILGALWYYYNTTPVVEGFDGAPLSDTLHPSSITNADTSTSYNIFDPSVAYLQADVYTLEYAIPLANLSSSESRFTTTKLPDLLSKTVSIWNDLRLEGGTYMAGHMYLMYNAYDEPSDFDEDTYRNIWNYSGAEDQQTIYNFYKTRDKLFMQKYNFTNRFLNNPIGFILSSTKPKDSYINCTKTYRNTTGSDIKTQGWIPTTIYKGTKSGNDIFVANGDTLGGDWTASDYDKPEMDGDVIATYNPNSLVPFKRFVLDNYFTGTHGGINANYGRGLRTEKLYHIYNYAKEPKGIPMCAKIPGEKDNLGSSFISTGVSITNSPGIDTIILSSPLNWSIKSFMKNPSEPVKNLINDFVLSKGGTVNTNLDYASQSSKLMYKSIPVIGTISDTNKTEIRKSVYYSMFFNFTDTYTTSHQICVGQDSPCKLYVFPDCSGREEFKYNVGVTERDLSAIAHNEVRRVELTDDILKHLPFQTRDYIRRWAYNRRTRIIKLYEQECAPLKSSFSSKKSTIRATTPTNSTIRLVTLQNINYINNIKDKCCPIDFNTFQNYTVPDYYYTGSNSTYDSLESFYGSAAYLWVDITNNSEYATPSQYPTSPMTCSATSHPILKRSFNEALGDESTDARGDVAPKFNLMSSPLLTPPVYIVRSQASFRPSFTLDTTATEAHTYKNTIKIDTQNGSSVLFLVPNIYVNVEHSTSSLNSYTAVVESYSNGTLNLKNIRSSGIFIDGKIKAEPVPGTLPDGFYTVSYTDNTAISQETTSTLTVSPDVITPIINGSVELKIPLFAKSNFPVNSNVFITNNSDASSYFSGKVSAAVDTDLHTLITVDTITNINTPFTNPALYRVFYINGTAINQQITTLTTSSEVITPTNNGSVNLKIPLSAKSNFPVNSNVFITNNSDASSYFSGKVSAAVDTALHTLITVDTITNINTPFKNLAVYAVILVNSQVTNQRFWLTTQEKQQILNMIAKKYYDLTNGEKKIQTILDVYQLGDTIFDIRYLEYKRDTVLTTKIQDEIRALKANYEVYRTYNLSTDQMLDLDLTYTKNIIELNNRLDNAVEGIGTDCGISARYIEIQRTDVNTATTTSHTDESGIQLSQVIVIDNTGNNAAVNSLVTASSTYLYDFEKTDLYSQISEPNCTIQADGSVKTSSGAISAYAGSCNPVSASGTTYTSLKCPRDDVTGVVSIKNSTTNNGDTSEMRSKKLTRNQSIVDGQVKLDTTTNRYNTRVMPYFFRTEGVTQAEKVTIDLGINTDIVKVRLVFPKGYTALPNYTIKFLNSSKNYINIPGTSATATATTETHLSKSGIRIAAADILDIDCSLTGRNPGLPVCVTELLEPYKVARFYANITGYQNGNPRASLPGLTFTGYSIGTNAALTFNRMYNAGFVLNTASGSGNINYNPRIQYDLNPIISALPTGSSNLCNVNSGKFLINIMRDYMTNISQYSFLNRPDVRSKNYDPSTYSYNVTLITGAKETSAGKYEIRWKETPTNLSTNVKDALVERWGLFIYKRNLDDWTAINEYYDIQNSILRDNGTGINYDNCNIVVPELLPAEAMSLDDAGGMCPIAKCSDINVINQLVQGFNDISGSKQNRQILRVTKAVTVSPNRCDFEVFQQNGSVTATEKKNITMDLNVDFDNLSGCKYVWDKETEISDTTAGKFIQTNTPSLLHIYNYVSEVMQPYINSLTSIKTNLSTLITETTINTDYRTYLGDTYGAYGQIKDLSGCNAVDNNAGKAKCYSPRIMNEFMKAYNSANKGSDIIQQITHAGTASDTECDYLISIAPISTINGSSATISANGTTVGVRAKMKKSSDCSFSVDTTYNVNSYTAGLKSYSMTMTDANIRLMKPVALNQTPWTTPITLGTQTTNTTLNLTPTTSSVTLNVPRAPTSYVIGTKVSIVDMNNSYNKFNAVISSYNQSQTNSLTPAILTLNTITAISGTFNTPTKYTIRAIPSNAVTTQGIRPIETLDYVDCSSPYVRKIMQNAGFNIGSSIINKSSTVCETNNQQYEFRASSNVKINSLETVISTSGKSGSVTNSRTTSDNTNMDDSSRIINSISVSQAQALYPSIDNTTPISVSTNTWDFRVNTSDTLPFGDIYKRIHFYRDSSSNIRIRQIRDAPLDSNFAFFKIYSPTNTSTLNACANLARDWWNTQYATATSTENKFILGDISRYYHDAVNDKVIFAANVCEYGAFGPSDIRVNPKTAYFSVNIRQKYGQTSVNYNRSTPNSNTIFVFSMEKTDTAPSGTLINFSNPYSAMQADSAAGYDPSKTLDTVLRASSKFRHLRFSVQKTPNSSISGTDRAVEILEMSFYKNLLPTPTTTPLLFNYATYSVDGIELLNYNVYDTPNLTSSTALTISPVVNGNITLTALTGTGIFSTNDNVIIYDTPTATKYILGVITNVSENSISIRCTSVVGNFINPVKYTIAFNKCKSNYTASSDEYLLSYMKCRLTNPITYNMLTTRYETFDLPCGIGYVQSGNVCTSTGIYSSVIRQNPNKNLSVPRLQLKIDQYFNINLNEEVEIKYFNFTTGVANTRPQRWKLEGSMSGLPNSWITLNSVTSDYAYTDEVLHTTSIKTASNRDIYSFVTTNFFPIFSGTAITRRNDSGTPKNYVYDPSISSSTPYVENFQNPTILDVASNPKFRRRVPNLENSYLVPLEQPASNIPVHMQVDTKRRIQFLRIKILSTRKNTGFIHMSNLQIMTPLGPLPTTHYKITNPMGIHPNRKNGPEALSIENGIWIISNNEPLLIKFSSLPQVILEGFKFSVPQNSRAQFDSLPATWIVDGSYDGRIWSTYHEMRVPETFSSYDSPLYKFLKHI